MQTKLARIAAALWPVVFFGGLTVLLTWPLVTDLSHSIIEGITADADVSRWDLWWVKTALFDRHTNPFYTDMLYYPYRDAADPLPLFYHTLQPLNGLLALPALLLADPVTGPTLGYNLLVLAHFTLTGCAMFWLVRYLTQSVGGGLVAGALFAFSPFHQYHLHEAQLELIPIEWLPLFILFLHKFLYQGRRPRDGVLAILFLVATTFTSWYWALYLLIAAALLGLVRLYHSRFEVGKDLWRERRATVLATGAVLLGWAVIVSPLLLATIRAGNDPTFELVSGLDYEVRFSLSPLDLFTVVKDARMTPPVWFMGTLGFSAMGLAAVGLVRLRKWGVFWGLLLVMGVALSLGPYLKWGDANDVAHTTGVPLPYLLVRNLPFMSIARVPRRFVLLADIGLDVFAGAGAAYLIGRASRFGARLRVTPARGVQATAVAVTLLLLALPLAEFAVVPQPLKPVALSPFFSLLAADPSTSAILELPVTSHYLRDHSRMLYQTVHGKKILGGYVARPVRDYYLTTDSPFYGFIDLAPTPKQDILPPLSPFGVLNYYDITYLVFYKDDESYQQPGDRAEVEAYLRRLFPDSSAIVADDAMLTAYRVPAVAPAPLVWAGEGWQPPETQEARIWRWSSGQESDIQILSKTALTWPLHFTAAAFHGTAHLTVSANGKPLRTLTLGQTEQPYDLGNVSLPAGASTLTFESDAPAISPVDAGVSSRETRKLGFLLTNLGPLP
ncbi:MAG: hypothetical protein ACR2M0_14360 [Chloroflexia bacterium]